MKKPAIMGIVNITPDSFSDGGKLGPAAISHALALVEEGADCLDLGGESTRPGALEVSEADEHARVLPVLKELRKELPDFPISIDTRRSSTAQRALEAGATLINDVRAGRDPKMFPLIASTGCEIILMHSRGTPNTMMGMATYTDVVTEVWAELAERRERAMEAGIAPEKIILDPGLGFAKELSHNLSLLNTLSHYTQQRVIIGGSRKRFIGQITGENDPKKRVAGSVAMALFAIQAGVEAVRVHDVAATRQALMVWQAMADLPLEES